MFHINHVLAYLDPGTGSLIAQFLIAGIISATAVFSGSLARVKRFFAGSVGRTSSSQLLLPSNKSEAGSTEVPQHRQAA